MSHSDVAARPPGLGEIPMRLFTCFSGPRRLASPRRCLCAGLALAGCADNEDMAATGSPFSQALFKDYTDLAHAGRGRPCAASYGQ